MQLDLVLVALTALAVLGGLRAGFIRRSLGWLFAFASVAGVSLLLPSVIGQDSRADPGRFLAATGLLLATSWVGYAIGSAIGSRVRSTTSSRSFGRVDSLAGGVLGLLSMVILAWMVIPAMATIPGWPQRAASQSRIAAAIRTELGAPPAVLNGAWKALGADSLPDLVAGLSTPTGTIGIPADSPVSADTVARLKASVVRVSGPACGNEKSGSGFVVRAGLVVTNAHVVAGLESITVTSNNDDFSAVLVAFDPELDLAVLRVNALKATPLPLGEPVESETGAVLGYPGGGALRVQPYRLDSTTNANTVDIYGGGPVQRTVSILGAQVKAGDSGGPLVVPNGEVHGVVYAVAKDHPGIAYAIGTDDVDKVLATVGDDRVDTGPCN